MLLIALTIDIPSLELQDTPHGNQNYRAHSHGHDGNMLETALIVVVFCVLYCLLSVNIKSSFC